MQHANGHIMRPLKFRRCYTVPKLGVNTCTDVYRPAKGSTNKQYMLICTFTNQSNQQLTRAAEQLPRNLPLPQLTFHISWHGQCAYFVPHRRLLTDAAGAVDFTLCQRCSSSSKHRGRQPTQTTQPAPTAQHNCCIAALGATLPVCCLHQAVPV
jgi:hypothetical protein